MGLEIHLKGEVEIVPGFDQSNVEDAARDISAMPTGKMECWNLYLA